MADKSSKDHVGESTVPYEVEPNVFFEQRNTSRRRARPKSTVESACTVEPRDLPAQPTLIVIRGAQLGQELLIDEGKTTIGRDEACGIAVLEQEASRQHAVLRRKGLKVMVQDLDSRNGVFVNEKRYKKKSIRNGDYIRIGRTIFKYLTAANAELRYHDEMKGMIATDSRTRTYNRKHIFKVLSREIGRSNRHGCSLSAVKLEVDHFKKLESIFGADAGDYVIKKVANLVRENTRGEDVIARLSSSQFVILLPETAYGNAIICADKLRLVVDRYTFAHEGIAIPVTISLGVAQHQHGAVVPEQLIKIVDLYLREAKAKGRNRVFGLVDAAKP